MSVPHVTLASAGANVQAALRELDAAHDARTVGLDHVGAAYHVARAQVHATLAVAATTYVAGGRR